LGYWSAFKRASFWSCGDLSPLYLLFNAYFPQRNSSVNLDEKCFARRASWVVSSPGFNPAIPVLRLSFTFAFATPRINLARRLGRRSLLTFLFLRTLGLSWRSLRLLFSFGLIELRRLRRLTLWYSLPLLYRRRLHLRT